MIRKSAVSASLAGLALAAGAALAQAQPQPQAPLQPQPPQLQPQMPPPPPHAAGRPLPPHLAQAPAAVESSTRGKLVRWLVNPNGDADGLLLDNGLQVNVPPHLSPQLAELARPGDVVEVQGWRSGAAPVLRALQVRANGKVVADANGAAVPPPARPFAALTELSAGGRIARVLHTGAGDASGVLLEDGTIVRFPPHVGVAIAGWMQPGAALYATGWGTRGALGTAVEATRLGASAQSLQAVGDPRQAVRPALPAPRS